MELGKISSKYRKWNIKMENGWKVNKKRKRAFEDLSGLKFGKLTVLYRSDDYVTKSGTVVVKYKCVCDCGKEHFARATSLKSGKSTSCGCTVISKLKKSLMGVNLEDLTGQIFSRWTVLHRAESAVEPSGRKATVWHCRCECGAERDVRAHSLKQGLTQSCGCLKHDVSSTNRGLVGQKFGRWTVVKRKPDRSTYGHVYRVWHCKCECGTERGVVEQTLISGKSVSCGCYRLERLKECAVFEDLTGCRFGSRIVLSRAPDRFYENCDGRTQMWYCRCDCGQENIVASNMLKLGNSASCGCTHSSRPEFCTRLYLDKMQLAYETRKTYEDLYGVGESYLSYDFLVYLNDTPYCLIECQGEQHFRPIKFFGGEPRFKIQQEHDRRKRQYADSIGLPLIEMHYMYRTYDAIEAFLNQALNFPNPF